MRIVHERAVVREHRGAARSRLYRCSGVPATFAMPELTPCVEGARQFTIFPTGDPFTVIEDDRELEGADVLVVQGDGAPDLAVLLVEALQTAYLAKRAGARTCRLLIAATLRCPFGAFGEALVRHLASHAEVDVLAYSPGLATGVAPPGAVAASERALRSLFRLAGWLGRSPAPERGTAPHVVIGGRSHPAMARRIAEHVGGELHVWPARAGAAGAPSLVDMVRLCRAIGAAPGHVVVVQTTRGLPGTDGHVADSPCAMFFEALAICATARYLGATEVTLVMPYMLNARSDRAGRGHAAYASLVARWIDGLALTRVILVEPHDVHVPEYFRTRVVVIDGAELLCREILARTGVDRAVVVAPDAGALRRVRTIRALEGLPVVVGDKLRVDHAIASKAHAFEPAELEGKRCLVFDDELASGTTLRRTLEHLSRAGASEIHVGVAHANLPQHATQRCDVLRGVLARGPANQTRLYLLDTQPLGGLPGSLANHVQVLTVAEAIAASLGPQQGVR